MRWGSSPGHGNPAPRCGKAVLGTELLPWQWGASLGTGMHPKVWEPALAVGVPAAGIPDQAPPGREPTAVQPPRPSSCSHTLQCGGCLGAPVPQTISGGRTALQLCRQLFEGEQREQTTHLRLAAGTEGRCPLRKQGQTSRTCLVSLLSPCSWSRQFSHPPQCSSSSSSLAPGNARGAGSWGLAQLLAPGPPEPWSPGCSMPGSVALAPAALSLPAGLGAGHSTVGSSREPPALGETSGRLLGNCRRMGTACHSPNDCHSLIISGQRGWQHNLTLPNSANAVGAVGAKH